MVRRAKTGLTATLYGLLLSGCAESVMINSYPAGAKVHIDDRYIGTTPAQTSIPRAEVSDPHTYRVEFRDCDVAEGLLRTGIGGGRVVGYIFTVGLTAAFKGPRYFLPVSVEFTGGGCEPPLATSKPPAQPGITIQQIVGDRNVSPVGGTQDVSNTQKFAERLSILHDLRVRKLISEEVYERERDRAIQELTQ